MRNPQILHPDDFYRCIPLLESYPFKPYSHYAHLVDDHALTQLFVLQLWESLKNSSTAFWIQGLDGAEGLVFLTLLPWDSQQLGIRVARLEHLIALGDYERQYLIKESLLAAVLEECAGKGIRYLISRVHTSDLSTIHLLERHGFIIVDGILTFSADIRNARWASPPPNLEIRLARSEDIEPIKAIARSSFIYDRFHSDPLIPKAIADELHAVWVENSCLGKAAEAVIVATEKGQILGFVTCRIDRRSKKFLGLTIGTIVLVATAPGARNKGVAKAVTYGALAWFKDQGVDFVEVGTQLRNIPASRLYESCGFRLVASGLTLRRSI